jgi:hypothetical protein
MGKMKNVYKILVKKPEGKSPLRPRNSWEDKIRMHLKEIGCKVFIWLRYGSVAGSCEHGNKPSGPIKGGEFSD